MTKMHMQWAANYIANLASQESKPDLAQHFAAMFQHFNPVSTAAASW